ncbi:MAG: hypothetical protein RMM17_13660 [Acidobacteriota bacterium]|nr:hypothetical protein [Blastocatellia bacterium]MDW8413714.1 hypothetical protein [Acidobacteriota bacterium]
MKKDQQLQATLNGTHASNLTLIGELLRRKQQRQLQQEVVSTLESLKTDGNPTTVSSKSLPCCPSCVHELQLENGLLVCRNCNKMFVPRVPDNLLVPTNSLPIGACKCCNPKRPLITKDDIIYCSLTNERYAQYLGEYKRLQELPYGTCSCCNPTRPLIARSENILFCPHSLEEYMLTQGGIQKRFFTLASSIEEALNAGTARFYYGGFITKK